MYRKFVNARSPLRLLEKGLHGGLGIGNLGFLVAGHGVGKTPFLVGVALDELLRQGTVLHVALDQTVSHVRAHYDTVFEALAASTHLDDAAATHLLHCWQLGRTYVPPDPRDRFAAFCSQQRRPQPPHDPSPEPTQSGTPIGESLLQCF